MDEWTDGELARLRSLAEAGPSVSDMARELGRSEAAIRERLAIEQARRRATPAKAASGAALEWNGPDEEGDVPPPTGRADDDPAAWVHSDRS
jgi:hypothetical protein